MTNPGGSIPKTFGLDINVSSVHRLKIHLFSQLDGLTQWLNLMKMLLLNGGVHFADFSAMMVGHMFFFPLTYRQFLKADEV